MKVYSTYKIGHTQKNDALTTFTIVFFISYFLPIK